MTRHILANLEFSPLPICAPICTLPFLFCFCRSLELRRGKARCLMCDEYPHSVTRNAQVLPRGVTDHVTVPFIQTPLPLPPPRDSLSLSLPTWPTPCACKCSGTIGRCSSRRTALALRVTLMRLHHLTAALVRQVWANSIGQWWTQCPHARLDSIAGVPLLGHPWNSNPRRAR